MYRNLNSLIHITFQHSLYNFKKCTVIDIHTEQKYHLIHIDQLYPYHYMGLLFHTFLVGLFTFIMEDYQIPSLFITILYYESYIYTNTYKPCINIY